MFLVRLLKRLFIDQWRAIDAEVAAEQGGDQPGFDWRTLVVLVTVAVSLTLQEYLGDRSFFMRHFPALAHGHYGELRRQVWWAGWRFLGYVVMPIIVILCMPGERLRDYYVGWRGFIRHAGVYLLLFLLVLPFVIGASRFQGFQHIYPFYKLANRSAIDLWVWEGFYMLQFVSLEFFFRGFMLKALRPRFGAGAIFVMIVPYCMIHFGKPMPEVLGAIVAGLVLGTLSMRTRSIWGGVFIHMAVALTMDLLALGSCPPMGSGRPCPM